MTDPQRERSLWELTVREVLERTASADPTPGGGSVAALSGSLGLGLVIMALEVSARHRDAEGGLAGLLEEARALLGQMDIHPDADVRAFGGYIAALARPKSDPGRAAALGSAATAATRAPLETARDLLAGLELAAQAADLSQRQVVSDVGAGAGLLGGALHGALLTVDINLAALPEAERTAAREERGELARTGEGLTRRVLERVSERLADGTGGQSG
ncbi:MAG: cyclodeaminase/cyclohydrolase family protein [Deinococcus sp.]